MSQTQNQVVSLGCGTLIVIAIIVIVFAGNPDSGAIQELRREVRELKEQVQKQTQAIEMLRKQLEESKLPPSAEPAVPSRRSDEADPELSEGESPRRPQAPQ